jgi:hypothetical protein
MLRGFFLLILLSSTAAGAASAPLKNLTEVGVFTGFDYPGKAYCLSISEDLLALDAQNKKMIPDRN